MLIKNEDGTMVLDQEAYKQASKTLGYCAAMCTQYDCLDSMRGRDELIADFELIKTEPHRESFVAGVTETYEDYWDDSLEEVLEKATRYENI